MTATEIREMKRCRLLRMPSAHVASCLLGLPLERGSMPPIPEPGTTVRDAQWQDDGSLLVKLHNPDWEPVGEGEPYPMFGEGK